MTFKAQLESNTKSLAICESGLSCGVVWRDGVYLHEYNRKRTDEATDAHVDQYITAAILAADVDKVA